jgi:hypothetical protein
MVKALVSALVTGIVVGYPSTSPASLDGRDTPGTVAADSAAPIVSIHARHVQSVSPGVGIRLSIAANESCFVRVRSAQLISKLTRVSAGSRTAIEMRPEQTPVATAIDDLSLGGRARCRGKHHHQGIADTGVALAILALPGGLIAGRRTPQAGPPVL